MEPDDIGLLDYFLLPLRLEYVLDHGMLLCVSSLLNEMTIMPISAAWSLLRYIFSIGSRRFTLVQKTNLLRTGVLLFSVWTFNSQLDFSTVYHFVRAQSSLKLYFLFNMLEIFERQVRSWGNDMLHWAVNALVKYEAKETKLYSVCGHWISVFVYTLMHGYIHFWRVMLVTVAIVSSDSLSMFMIILTNNFAELKSTVEKVYHLRSLYPVLSRDIVERMYLFVDVVIVLFRMATSPQKGKMPFVDVAYWVGIMIFIEVLTDWVKFVCITKRNRISPPVFSFYEQIHHIDVLNGIADDLFPLGETDVSGSSHVIQKYAIALSPSHLTAGRMNFVSTPLTALILSTVMLFNLEGADVALLWLYRLLLFSGLLMLKIIIDWILVGKAVKASGAEGMGTFAKSSEDLNAFRAN